jgi:hypothetical protein
MMEAMISSEVQRTLVKSPPELWAELSDPAALARHLGELGEIRIIRTEPESVVEWAAENTSGIVAIKASGWGTKVTLSATRETMASAPTPDVTGDAETVAEDPANVAAEPEPGTAVADAEFEPAAEPTLAPDLVPLEPAPEPEPAAMTPQSEAEPAPEPEQMPRRGFFARLFGRRRQPAPAIDTQIEEPALEGAEVSAPDEAPALERAPESSPERPDAFAAVRDVLARETFAAAHPFATGPSSMTLPARDTDELEAGGGSIDEISAELMAAEEVTAEEVTAEVTAVLTAVLDRLGAAHHRPFSRS